MELRTGYNELMSTQRPDAPPKEAPGSYLHPGQMGVRNTPTVLSAILGSCVAVCIWDPGAKVAGMVHYMLPEWAEGNHAKSPRYGDVAIQALLEQAAAMGASPRRIGASIFGGGCVLKAFRDRGEDHLGAKNVEVARRLLKQAGISVIREETLGNFSRKVTMDCANGAIFVKVVGE